MSGQRLMQKVDPTQIAKTESDLAWGKWREESAVCDKKVSVNLKHNIYKTVVKPTVTYNGAQCWTMKKKDG